MKRAFFLSTPPIAFIAAAMLAGLVPLDDATRESNQAPSTNPQNLTATLTNLKSSSSDISDLLTELERRFVHFPPMEVENYDAEGMENDILIKKAYAGAVISWAISYEHEWARKSPQKMFEWLIQQSIVFGNERQSLAQTLFSEWATQDMAAALSAISNIPHADIRAQALVSTLEVLCEKNPIKAREILLQNLTSLEALKTVKLGFDSSKALTEFIQTLPAGRLRSLFLAEYIDNLIMFDYDGNGAVAIELWKQASIEERQNMVADGLCKSSSDKIQLDGLENLVKQHAETTKDPMKASLFVNYYGESWVERDPGSAISWTLTHLRAKDRTDQCLKLIKHAASHDFDKALQAWKNLPTGSLRDEATDLLLEAAPADRKTEKSMLQESLPKSDLW